jgi:hypothetical protein
MDCQCVIIGGGPRHNVTFLCLSPPEAAKKQDIELQSRTVSQQPGDLPTRRPRCTNYADTNASKTRRREGRSLCGSTKLSAAPSLIHDSEWVCTRVFVCQVTRSRRWPSIRSEVKACTFDSDPLTGLSIRSLAMIHPSLASAFTASRPHD